MTPVYGLDIETDTARGGLDPRRCRVLAAAVVGPDSRSVFTGSERTVLADLDQHIADLAGGVIVTWNGAAFDLPFLATRARRAGVATGLRLALDPGIPMSHPPLSGHEGAYRGAWYDHRHLDAYRAYRALEEPGSCALKAVARRRGFDVMDCDPSRVHELRTGALRRYVARDAELALQLALVRMDEMAAFVDRPPRVSVVLAG